MTDLIVILNKATGRFLTAPGLCRGWSNDLRNAQMFTTPEDALKAVPGDARGHVEVLYLYVFRERLDWVL